MSINLERLRVDAWYWDEVFTPNVDYYLPETNTAYKIKAPYLYELDGIVWKEVPQYTDEGILKNKNLIKKPPYLTLNHLKNKYVSVKQIQDIPVGMNLIFVFKDIVDGSLSYEIGSCRSFNNLIIVSTSYKTFYSIGCQKDFNIIAYKKLETM